MKGLGQWGTGLLLVYETRLRDSTHNVILIINNSIKQKDEQPTRLFVEARLRVSMELNSCARVQRNTDYSTKSV